MEIVSPYHRARFRERIQGTGKKISGLIQRLRYSAKDPEAWKVEWDNYKKFIKGQTRLVEEKLPEREIRQNYVHD